MYQFKIGDKVYQFKTLREARFYAMFNVGTTIISKVQK